MNSTPRHKPTVVIGLVGSQLDKGSAPARWERWRPTVGICQQPDLLIERLELLYQASDRGLAERVRDDVVQVSPQTRVVLREFPLGDPWDFEEVFGALHDFSRAYDFQEREEEYLLHITTGTHVAQICMFLLAESRHIPARLLQSSPKGQRGAMKGVGGWRVIDLDLSRYDRLASRFVREQGEATTLLKGGIATRNAAFNRLIDELELVARRSREPILLTGPTGAGKTQLARRIYDLKVRQHQLGGDYVVVNCATLRGDGAMSALFGHRRGAYTGAAEGRAGLLKSADQGLVFLDEIAELGLDEQAMLLRALETRRFLPLGADAEVESDFQLIAGTNADLVERVERGLFRADLLARINLWSFELPGLAERREDIEPNLDYELQRYAERQGERVRLNREARERFLGFALSEAAVWRANFRDLSAAVVRMATLASGGVVTEEVVEGELRRLSRQWQRAGGAGASPRSGGDSGGSGGLAELGLEALDDFDAVQLRHVIAVCRRSASLSEAGRTLFAVSRARRRSRNDADRLRKYLKKFELDWESIGGGCLVAPVRGGD
ncbi:transcriptional regulator [Lujinxingia litoralis]|uniref:Transcriptional regulator n=1 Tax=Lujinxingia litoralis TaxID=2211119 RepID=A0A328C2T2_9DELT|nr:RNA repair transcriptional activator RtcR [Lujinxingia litoralis]RAL21123.1 transcriptional regulator [Lujinxingia litoralis]